MLILKILGAVAALALGVWLGLPGRYESDPEEIDRVLGEEGTGRARATRHFLVVDWFFRGLKRSRKKPRGRRHFHTVTSRDPDGPRDGPG
jgi:hypothetical protein